MDGWLEPPKTSANMVSAPVVEPRHTLITALCHQSLSTVTDGPLKVNSLTKKVRNIVSTANLHYSSKFINLTTNLVLFQFKGLQYDSELAFLSKYHMRGLGYHSFIRKREIAMQIKHSEQEHILPYRQL